MELRSEHFRAMIFYDFKRNLSAAESLANLTSAFGEQAPSRATVFNWFAEFRRGRASLEDEQRSGRPVSVAHEDSIAAVEKLVKADPRVTCHQIEASLGLSSASLNRIMHDHLQLRKLSARWIPHLLTEEQKQKRIDFCNFMLQKFDVGASKQVWDIVTGDETWIYQYDPETKRQSSQWVFPGENAPQKCIRSRSIGRQMVASFFCAVGHVATVPLETQRTVNAEWYCTVCIPQVLENWSRRRPKTGTRGLLWHHDNASAHTAARTQDFLQERSIRLLPHPPYSPDLAPCDFFLFPNVKDKIRGVRFNSPEEAREAFETALDEIPKEIWRKCFAQDWFRRMQLCIDCGGGYFEKI